MATHRLFIPASAFLPDTSGNVYPKPSSIDDANDYAPREVLAFKDSGTAIRASATFQVPADYVGTPKAQVIWKANATSGAAVWDVDFVSRAVGESLDPSASDESETVTTTTDATALDRNESEVTPTGSTFTAEDLVLLRLTRDGADAADTLAAEALLEGVAFEYSDT
jgi:hypothetical protein